MANFPTNVFRAPNRAFAGQIANGRVDRIASKYVPAGAPSISAGKFVAFHNGDAERAVRLPTAADEVDTNRAMGVVVLDVTRQPSPGTAELPYVAGETLAVMRQGEIWVIAEEAVDPSSPVYVRITESSGGAADQGSFRASADSGKAIFCPGLAYGGSAGIGGLVVLHVNLPTAWVVTGPTGPTA